MPELKRVLFEEYGGFADKRIKRLENGRVFLIDDRENGALGADNKPLSWFCSMYVEVVDDDHCRLILHNWPTSDRLERWSADHRVNTDGAFAMNITRGSQALVSELAGLMRAIVAPGARYGVNFYKHSCPRVAASLDRLKNALDRAWIPGGSREPQPDTGLF